MEQNPKNEEFHYTYSAKEQKEIKEIRERYAEKPSSRPGMEELRRLDERVQKAGLIPSLILGIVSTLVLGVGMCCTMVWGEELFIPGIIVGVIGIAGIALAYPLNHLLVKKRKKELAPRILELTEELMK